MAKRRIFSVALHVGDQALDLKNGPKLLPIIAEMIELIESEEGFEVGTIYTLAWNSVESDAAAPAADNSS